MVSKTQNDIGFSAMLPIRRRDIVKARIASVGILELIQLAVAAIFIPLNMKLYPNGNMLMDANVAFLGFSFVMYGIFNIILFPMFYKTAYKIAGGILTSLTVTMLFAAAVETVVKLVPFAQKVGGRDYMGAQWMVLVCGILLFFLLTFAAYRISAKRLNGLIYEHHYFRSIGQTDLSADL